jgi:hypothetical protein
VACQTVQVGGNTYQRSGGFHSYGKTSSSTLKKGLASPRNVGTYAPDYKRPNSENVNFSVMYFIVPHSGSWHEGEERCSSTQS